MKQQEPGSPEGQPLSLDELTAAITSLQAQLASQRKEIARLRAGLSQSVEATINQKVAVAAPRPTSRRKLLKRLALGTLLAGATGAVLSNPLPAQAKMIVPSGGNPGVVAVRTSKSVTGSPPAGRYYGLVASSDDTLNLGTQLVSQDTALSGIASTANSTGVYGSGTGYGVVGNSNNGWGVQGTSNTSYGIYGSSSSTTGIFGSGPGEGVHGTTTNGVGVHGDAVIGNGTGIAGTAFSGLGVLARSATGAPVRIYASATPTTGTRAAGDIYVDTNGRLYIYNGSLWTQALATGSNPGASVVRAGKSVTGNPPSGCNFGLVSSSDDTLNLGTQLPTQDTGLAGVASTLNSVGVYGSGNFSGVWGYSNQFGVYGSSGTGIGISGYSNPGTGVYGNSNSGTGVYGKSSSGQAVYCLSDTGVALATESGTGAPFRIYASEDPPSTGSRLIGDMYVDGNGNLFIWSFNGVMYLWRRVAFVS